MRTFVKNIVLGLVLLSFITASGGVHILVHYCNHAKKTNFESFPELTKSNAGCCCKEKSCDLEPTLFNQPVLSKSSCCENNDLTLKINIFNVPGKLKVNSCNLMVSTLFIQKDIDFRTIKTLEGQTIAKERPELSLKRKRHLLQLFHLPGDLDADPLS